MMTLETMKTTQDQNQTSVADEKKDPDYTENPATEE